jgi:hypothetical protein
MSLPDRSPMSTGPFAVGGRLAAPSVYIAAEPGWVGQARYLVIAFTCSDGA